MIDANEAALTDSRAATSAAGSADAAFAGQPIEIAVLDHPVFRRSGI